MTVGSKSGGSSTLLPSSSGSLSPSSSESELLANREVEEKAFVLEVGDAGDGDEEGLANLDTPPAPKAEPPDAKAEVVGVEGLGVVLAKALPPAPKGEEEAGTLEKALAPLVDPPKAPNPPPPLAEPKAPPARDPAVPALGDAAGEEDFATAADPKPAKPDNPVEVNPPEVAGAVLGAGAETVVEGVAAEAAKGEVPNAGVAVDERADLPKAGAAPNVDPDPNGLAVAAFGVEAAADPNPPVDDPKALNPPAFGAEKADGAAAVAVVVGVELALAKGDEAAAAEAKGEAALLAPKPANPPALGAVKALGVAAAPAVDAGVPNGDEPKLEAPKAGLAPKAGAPKPDVPNAGAPKPLEGAVEEAGVETAKGDDEGAPKAEVVPPVAKGDEDGAPNGVGVVDGAGVMDILSSCGAAATTAPDPTSSRLSASASCVRTSLTALRMPL